MISSKVTRITESRAEKGESLMGGEARILALWSGQTLLRRRHLSKALKQIRKRAISISQRTSGRNYAKTWRHSTCLACSNSNYRTVQRGLRDKEAE